MEIQADHMIGPGDLMEKLNTALQLKINGMQSGLLPGQAYPLIEQIYPFESYINYSMRNQKYRQPYVLDNRDVRLTGLSTRIEANWGNATGGDGQNKESMPRVQTGVRYAYAPTRGQTQATTRGALNSELMTQVFRNTADVDAAVAAYLTAVKNGTYKPMKPSFAPVNLSDSGKITAALAKAGIAPLDFAKWSLEQKKNGCKCKGHVA